ncbi:unnamed protein product [Coffea canephora]|uniref:DH200=94 genomic scaffold, scaffold_3531 n=1 Tax=Coffea canephora TaxID=49390 RepID=A0A068VL75_COFCA|nr:unnamed protein product [Coffea canephora]
MAVDPCRRPLARRSVRRRPPCERRAADRTTPPNTTEARSSGVPRRTGDEHPTAARTPQPSRYRSTTRSQFRTARRRQILSPLLHDPNPSRHAPQSQSLSRSYGSIFVDFPYLHYSMRLEAAHLGDLLRISVRTGAKLRVALSRIFTVRVGITDTAAASGALRARVPISRLADSRDVQRSQRKENSSRIPRRLLRVHSGYPDEAHDNATHETPTLRV